MSHIFTGTGVAVVAPMKNGEVDYDAFRSHLLFLKENQTQSFIINGTTGESSTLTHEEKIALLKIALEVADGKVPVIAGTGTNNTQTTIEASVEAEKLGVDALLVITPYYNKTSQRGLIEHFTAVADAVNTPIIVYDVPSRTGMTITPETLSVIAKHKNIVGTKDATSDLDHLTRCRAVVDDSFAFYSGNDNNALPFYALGGDGLISVAGNVIPGEYQEMFEARFDNPKRALEIHERIMPLIDALGADVNPIPIKLLTSSLGFGEYEVRLPLVPMEEVNQIPLVEAFRELRGDS